MIKKQRRLTPIYGAALAIALSACNPASPTPAPSQPAWLEPSLQPYVADVSAPFPLVAEAPGSLTELVAHPDALVLTGRFGDVSRDLGPGTTARDYADDWEFSVEHVLSGSHKELEGTSITVRVSHSETHREDPTRTNHQTVVVVVGKSPTTFKGVEGYSLASSYTPGSSIYLVAEDGTLIFDPLLELDTAGIASLSDLTK